MSYRKGFIFASLIFLISAVFSPLWSQQPSENLRRLVIFHSPGCHNCVKIIQELMPGIRNKFQKQVRIDYRDLNELENYKLLVSLREKYSPKIGDSLPVFFMEGNFLEAGGKSAEQLEAFIQASLKSPLAQLGDVPSIDLAERIKAFTPAVIIGAGLVDGINPCAFTVIVFFISFLSLQGYRKRDLIIIGMTFVFAVFLTYLLLGLGLFGFLFSIKKFWFLIKVFNLSVGVFSLGLGIAAIYDIVKFVRTKSTEGMVLQLPASVKNQIHKVIGQQHRLPNNQGEENEVVKKRSVWKLTVSASVTGFLVSLLEAVCTGQTYLPTISFVLKTTPFKLKAAGLLVLYNLMFVVPLFGVFLLAMSGATSKQFSGFLNRQMIKIKVLMALLFFGLGLFLLFKA